MTLIKKYTTKRRSFNFSPDKRFITVYIDKKLNGFIWNIDRIILIDGEEVNCSEFFK